MKTIVNNILDTYYQEMINNKDCDYTLEKIRNTLRSFFKCKLTKNVYNNNNVITFDITEKNARKIIEIIDNINNMII